MKTGFFEEKPGVKSSTRLNSFILMLFMFAFDIIMALAEGFEVDYNFILLNFLFLLGVFTPKAIHKFAELKNGGGKE